LRTRNYMGELYDARCGQLRYVFCGFLALFIRGITYLPNQKIIVTQCNWLRFYPKEHTINAQTSAVLLWHNNNTAEVWARTMWSVTLRLLWFFALFFMFFTGLILTLFCKATDLGSIQKSTHYTVHSRCFMIVKQHKARMNRRTMWSVTLRLLWFLALFLWFYVFLVARKVLLYSVTALGSIQKSTLLYFFYRVILCWHTKYKR